MKTRLLSPAGKIGFTICAAFALSLTGCVHEHQHTRVVQTEPVFIEQDDYVYYPHYQVYYGNRSHRYYYQEGHRWVARPVPPRGMELHALRNSPSVPLEFHDRLPMHHGEVIRSYPRYWTPPPPPGFPPGRR